MATKRSRSGQASPSAAGAGSEAPDRRRGAFLVVGLGASAGGLEALERFFRAVPASCGMAFVVVQHLDPDHPSFMHDALARHCGMPVAPAQDGMRVKPDHVYVIPPNATLRIDRGALEVQRPAQPRALRAPINAFLSSLAEDQGESAVGIVLSGTGSDGSLGLAALKEQGGLILAQDPADAKYDSMPRSAIATGLVDIVLPAAEMPAALVRFAERFAEGTPLELSEVADDSRKTVLGRIAAILLRQTGHDFSRYRRSTLVRRVRRRMQMTGSSTVEEYIRRLHDGTEARDLFRDLLIGVTWFFRDPEAFQSLATTAIPALFEGRRPEEGVRVWVAGCATGEEAFSVAMLVRERMPRGDGPLPPVQIFATDIDDQALAVARAARYPEGIADQVPPDRLARFFVPEGGGYTVAKEIRELCIFSTHSLVRDPPFSRIDLLVCRNVLIYLEPDAQRRLLPIFHYAMRRGGFLLLGTSETVAGHSNLFRTVDKEQHLFQRRETLGQEATRFPFADLDPSRPHAIVARRQRGEREGWSGCWSARS
jgi:two-component system CheB/CheR fusion protein